MKKIAILIILAGLIFLGIGGFQIFQTHQAQKESLAEAHQLLENNEYDTDSLENGPDIRAFPDHYSPQTGNTLGILHIPALDNAELPIIEGTDPDELESGVGHYDTSLFPLQGGQIVLSGHRDTVFRGIGELEIGDIFEVELEYGTFEYELTHTQIVEADDTTIIAPKDHEELTVTTCYPFYYVGNAPQRYIMTALPVNRD